MAIIMGCVRQKKSLHLYIAYFSPPPAKENSQPYS